MLLIKTSVRPCKFGYGLFTEVDIPANAIIWQLNPIVDKIINYHSMQWLTDLEKEFIEKYAYNDGKQFILCSDSARYFNHSSDGYNCNDFIHPTLGSVTSAKRFIKSGEQLLSDYKQFDQNFDEYKHLLL